MVQKEAYKAGINYLGVCCGANPVMLIREVFESVGLKVLASKIPEDKPLFMLFGTHERIPQHQRLYEKA